MVSVALLWDWPIFAGLLLLGWTMFLRPGELLGPSVRRKDLVLPVDRLELDGDVFLRVGSPKTRRTFSAVQHGRCSDPAVK
eukprot:3140663-Lingulodinium_polyedra.AAC.1